MSAQYELPHGHSHSHSHDTDIPVSSRTRKAVLGAVIPAIALTVAALAYLWPGPVRTLPHEGDQRAYGDVASVTEQQCSSIQLQQPGGPHTCGTAQVVLTGGPGAGRRVTVTLPDGPGSPTLHVGDKVVLSYVPAATKGATEYSVVDHQRGLPLLFLVGVCALVVVAVARWRGFTALIGLAAGFAVLLLFIIPAILNGESPLLVAVVGAAAIMFAVLYLTQGFSVHTSVAILGTLISLVLTGLLGYAFTGLSYLTGFGNDESVYLSVVKGNVDMRGLLLAGIIIGAIGALEEVTVTQAVTVAELSQSSMSRLEMYRAASRVGRAHVGSAIHTIILAYAGASLPLMLLLTIGGQHLSDLLTSEMLAQEIVRSAVGMVGLVAAVPITTALAVLVTSRRPKRGVSHAANRRRALTAR
jgi:uncharacterized membrane protein